MIWRILTKVLARIARLLPEIWRSNLVERLIQAEVNRQPAADEALRFLFELEALIYSLEGPLAVKYGAGMHPKHRQTNYHDFFVARVKRSERVLDVGCGLGAVANDLVVRAGAIVDGIDYNETSIAEAQKRYVHPGLHFKVGDALALSSSHYETVVLSNVLEHITDRIEFLKDLQQKTRAKHFLIRVPLFERDWRVPLKKELGVEWRLDPDHKIEHTLEAFERETSKAGLKIQHIETRWGEIWAELKAKIR